MIGLGPIKMKIFGWFWLILQDLLTLNHNFGVECKFLEFHPKWILNIGESVDLRRFMRMKISIKVKVMTVMNVLIKVRTYLIFVIFFTLAKFLVNKIYTKKRQFFALNLSKMPIFRVKSVKIYTGQKKFTRALLVGSWQI